MKRIRFQGERDKAAQRMSEAYTELRQVLGEAMVELVAHVRDRLTDPADGTPRRLLEVLAEFSGLGFSLTTKGALILRDLDPLRARARYGLDGKRDGPTIETRYRQFALPFAAGGA